MQQKGRCSRWQDVAVGKMQKDNDGARNTLYCVHCCRFVAMHDVQETTVSFAAAAAAPPLVLAFV